MSRISPVVGRSMFLCCAVVCLVVGLALTWPASAQPADGAAASATSEANDVTYGLSLGGGEAAGLPSSAAPATTDALGTSAQGANPTADAAPAASTLPAPVAASAGDARTFSNVFVDTDIRQALGDLAMATGLTIIPDDSVSGTVTVDIKDAEPTRALDMLMLSGGFVYEEVGPGLYIVTTPDPKSALFRRVAHTEVVDLEYIGAEELQALLPDTYVKFVKMDKNSSRVTVSAPRELLAETVEQIKLLDVEPHQVLLEALAVETTRDSLDTFALDLQSSHGSLDTSTGLLAYTGAASSILHQVQALVSKGCATVRANPRVLAQEGKEASVRVATKQYFQILSGQVGWQYTTLESIEAGVGLIIVPRIAVTGRKVTCTLKAEVSDVTGTGANKLPIITARTAQSVVTVGDGQVIAISGLLQDVARKQESKIPILGDIPLIGKLFRSSTHESSLREIVIFVVPHILDGNGCFSGPLMLGTVPPGSPGEPATHASSAPHGAGS